MNVGKKALSLTLAFSMVASTFLSAGGFAAKVSRAAVDDSHDSNKVAAYIKDSSDNVIGDAGIVIKDSMVVTGGVAKGDTPNNFDADTYVWSITTDIDGSVESTSFDVTTTGGEKTKATVGVTNTVATGDTAYLHVAITRSWTSEDGVKDSSIVLTKTVKVTHNPGTGTPGSWNVNFELQADDADNKPNNQTIENGKTVTEPGVVPTRPGYRFDGWYTETGCINKWNFATTVTGDITLYAKWTKDAAAIVPVAGVVLSDTTATLEIGATKQLTATVAPAEATDKDVEWSSSNSNVATVDGGKVTAVAAGTATITATTVGVDANGTKLSATCAVTVNAAPVEDEATNITIDPATQTVEWAMTQKFTAVVNDAGGNPVPNAAVTWSVTGGASTINADGIFFASSKDANDATVTVKASYAGAAGYKASEAIATVTIKEVKATIYTVSFMDGDKELSTMSVIKGDTLEAFPDAPAKEGYTFKGWYTTATGTAKFNLDTKINKDTQIYAQYTENATVTFMADGKEYAKVSVEAGKKVSAPEAPKAPEGKAFKGWYVNVTDAEPFDFTTALTAGQKLTLTAVFVNVYKVTFVDGTTSNVVNVKEGMAVVPPKAVGVTGETFIGWYDADNNQFKGGKITKDLTLTAKYAVPDTTTSDAAAKDIASIGKVSENDIKTKPEVKAAVIAAVTQMDDTQKSKLASDVKALAAVEDNYALAAGITVDKSAKLTADANAVTSASIAGAALSAKPGETVGLAIASAEEAPALADNNALAELAGKTGSQQVSKIVKLEFDVVINGTSATLNAPVQISVNLEQSFNSSLSKLIHASKEGVEVVKNFSISGKKLTFTVSSLSPFAIVELTKKSSSGGGSSSSDNDTSSPKTPSTPSVPTTPVAPAQQTLASVSASVGVYSDTNVPVITRRGSVYTFLFKSTNGAVPTFTVGNGSVLQTYTVYKNGGYYFQVKAIGQPGQSTGVYCNIPGRTPLLVTTVTIN